MTELGVLDPPHVLPLMSAHGALIQKTGAFSRKYCSFR